MDMLDALAFEYNSAKFGATLILHADCFEWLGRIPENSIHSIVTDPPYGIEASLFAWFALFAVEIDQRMPRKSFLMSVPCREVVMNHGVS